MTEEEKLPVYLTERSQNVILVIMNLISNAEQSKDRLMGKLLIDQEDIDEIIKAISKSKEAATKHIRELYR